MNVGSVLNGFGLVGILNIACLERICYWKEYFYWEKDKMIDIVRFAQLVFVQNVCCQLGCTAWFISPGNCSLLTCLSLLNYLITILFDVASLLLKGMILEVLFYSVLQIQSKWNLVQIMKLAQCFHSAKIMRRNILCQYLSL